MLVGVPIRWTDPATWPWMFYVWAAFALAGLAKPAWSWLRRGRAVSWPVAEGRIESVEVSKPTFAFTTKSGYYVAELGYSYSIAGTRHSGRYRREFPSEGEAEEFVRDLQDRPLQFTTTRPVPPVLHCLNLISRFCCKIVRLPRLLTFPRRQTPFQDGCDPSFGSSSAFLPSVSS